MRAAEPELCLGDSAAVHSVRAAVLEVPVDAHLRAYGNDMAHVVFAEVSDLDGRIGTGFTYTFGPGCAAVRAMVTEVIAGIVEGSELSTWDSTRAELLRATRRLGRSVFAPAISAVDVAVWDLRGLRGGLPIYRLRGRTATSTPIYGSGRSANSLTREELIDGVASYLSEGYLAVKVRVGARRPEDDLERVSAVRDAVGEGIRIMVDCNERLDMPSALWLAERLADLGVYWIEEPFPAEDLAAYRALARRCRPAIAAGEHLVGRAEFATYIDEEAASVLQPDVALTGGISEGGRICSLAAAHHATVSLHSLPELHVQLAAGDPNVSYVEHFPVIDTLIAEHLQPEEGLVRPPERPGHGIVWDYDAIDGCTVAGSAPRPGAR